MSNLTPNGNTSLKPRQGRSWKRARRIEIVARLEAAFISDQDIATTLGLTVAAIQFIKKSPEYLAKRIALASGVLSNYDLQRLISEESKKEELEELVPMALLGVRNILSDKNHPHFARVATDILDRHKSTSKISRTEHSVAPLKSNPEKDRQAQELLSLLEPDKTINAPDYDPTKTSDDIDQFHTPNPRIRAPEFVELPDQDQDPDPNTIVPKEELDKAIETNPDVNDLIM